MLGTTAARLASNRAQSHIAIDSLKPALAQLHRLLMCQIPKDMRPIPGIHGAISGEIQIPLEYSRTRQAFFIYLRSLYESIIRVNLRRRDAPHAHEMLEDMRRNCYLPPTKPVYDLFIRYHAKRKNISRLREIHDMMLQDGVPLDEDAYTRLMISCMFTPRWRLLATLTARASRSHAADTPPAAAAAAAETEIDTGISDSRREQQPLPQRPDLATTPDTAVSAQCVDDLVYYPRDCIRFFEDMLLDYRVAPNNIRDEGFRPNVHITNAVMRAYLMIEKPVLALREFFRYRYHMNQQYPHRPPPDVISNQKTVAHVFRMALDAAEATGDSRIKDRIYQN
ncbi:hypothetical protein H4R21_007052, partial [Coemansia helicoidea]